MFQHKSWLAALVSNNTWGTQILTLVNEAWHYKAVFFFSLRGNWSSGLLVYFSKMRVGDQYNQGMIPPKKDRKSKCISSLARHIFSKRNFGSLLHHLLACSYYMNINPEYWGQEYSEVFLEIILPLQPINKLTLYLQGKFVKTLFQLKYILGLGRYNLFCSFSQTPCLWWVVDIYSTLQKFFKDKNIQVFSCHDL